MDVFLPAYLGALAEHMANLTDPALFIKTLLTATQESTEYGRPDHTLAERVTSHLVSALEIKQEDLNTAAEAFYQDVYPDLRSLTAPNPHAVATVEAAFSRGYRVVIATNPLFPATAIWQRLEWAGLPVTQYPFDLITTAENFHFAKPNPIYYAEVLAQMGWPDGPVLMVGNEIENDIFPAHEMELIAFWVTEHGEVKPESEIFAHGSGSLEDFLPWLDEKTPELRAPELHTIPAVLSVLRATPAALATMTDRLRPVDWLTPPDPKEWSATEIICHLRDVEAEVNHPRIRKVLNEENPFIPGQDTDRWAAERAYNRQDGLQALRAFTAARLENLDRLDGLSPIGWERPARHALFGPTNLHELVNIMAAHDRQHLSQMRSVLQTR